MVRFKACFFGENKYRENQRLLEIPAVIKCVVQCVLNYNRTRPIGNCSSNCIDENHLTSSLGVTQKQVHFTRPWHSSYFLKERKFRWGTMKKSFFEWLRKIEKELQKTLTEIGNRHLHLSFSSRNIHLIIFHGCKSFYKIFRTWLLFYININLIELKHKWYYIIDIISCILWKSHSLWSIIFFARKKFI